MSWDCRVVESPEVRARFVAAARYRRDYFGAASARKLLDAREAAIGRLAKLPESGAPLVVEGLDVPLRWVLVYNYVLVYRAIDASHTVMLEGLFHAGEDWKALLGAE